MYEIPSLELNITEGILVMIVIVTIILIFGYYNIHYSENEKIMKIREQMKELSISN